MRLQGLVGGAAEVIGGEASLAEAASSMVDAEADALAVLDGRALAGILTERDLIRAMAADADPDATLVSEWMTPAPDTVTADVRVRDAVLWMLEMGYRHLPVVDGSELLGIVGVRDLLFALSKD